MRFITSQECQSWCSFMQNVLDDSQHPSRQWHQPYWLRCSFPTSFAQLLPFSRCIETALQPRESCRLWMTDYGVFHSNENWHLYYRLRQSYGDFRLMHEAPGHLCLSYEQTEVVSLVHLSILFGWDVHLLPTAGYGRAFVSHDEFVDFGFDDENQFNEMKVELGGFGVKITVSGNNT